MKTADNTSSLLSQHPIISDQIDRPALKVVLRELEGILKKDIPGDIAEFGCYIGTTSLFLRRLLDIYASDSSRQLFAYDSFSGLPDKTDEDASGAGEQFQAGELTVGKKQFLHEFQKANLKPPITIKGWFSDIQSEQLPSQIAFAFLDGDFYASIWNSLRLVWPRLVRGGVITIDDYNRAALPGVERAVQEFAKIHGLTVRHEHQIAIITR